MLGLKIHRIEGVSMAPNYHSGDYVLSYCFGAWHKYQAGDVVLIEHKVFGKIIKRIHTISPEGSFSMQGDSIQSTTIEALGSAKSDTIIGKVFYRISK